MTAAISDVVSTRECGERSQTVTPFVAAVLGIALLACILAGFLPVSFSILTVFLFAGPHNWLECRYMLSRMPARWGPLRPYFLIGLVGVPLLTGSLLVLPWLASAAQWTDTQWLTGLACWNTLLVLWIAVLVHMRSGQPPRRDWLWIWPLALGVIGVNWLWPSGWSLLLVYAHPLVALWFLDRELRRHPRWRRAYRGCLAVLPLMLVVLWWRLASSPDLPGQDVLTGQITRHAGSDILPHVSTHLLVSTHTFLEMLHYAIWVFAIPLLTLPAQRWKLTNVPLSHKSPTWRYAVMGVIGLGVILVTVLWAGFLADYPLTRDIYFSVAILHVLAEVPFLLRLL